ncbi:MAG TPA: DHH family phosphoesterase [Phycisphaerae bacterium]|nr:DHH family phosphoesterase [Phycisphaerae bacterium]
MRDDCEVRLMDVDLFRKAGQRVAGWRRIMILSHDRPDGDALGAMAGMQRVLQGLGHQAVAFTYDTVPPRYTFIDEIAGFHRWSNDAPADIDARFDGLLIVDTCSWSQLEPAAEYLKASRLPKVVLDHHATRDLLTVNHTDDIYAIDATSASACGLAYEWCELMGWPVDCKGGEALFAGMAADTGWFRFSNTDGRTMRAAAALLERCNLRADILYTRLNASYSPARLRLMRHMLDTLEFHADGKVATIELTREMFEKAGATPTDAEELVNEPMAARSVMATVLMTDMGDGVVRLNFRSKSPELIGREIDVAAIAHAFGGGGHHRAAGARVPGTLSTVRPAVLAAVLAAVT